MMNATCEESLDLPFVRAQTARRRVSPIDRANDEMATVAHFARMCHLGFGSWYVIEIGSDEDWAYVAAEIDYPGPFNPNFELWVTFEGVSMRLYPSEEPLAIEYVQRKVARWEHSGWAEVKEDEEPE